MRRVTSSRRRGMTLVLAIMAFGIICLFVTVLARLALLDAVNERKVAVDSYAEQVVRSAQAWSAAHPEQVRNGGVIEVPIDELLPGGVEGQAELSRVDGPDGVIMAECRITLSQGRQRVHRRLAWPLPSAATAPPASDAATP